MHKWAVQSGIQTFGPELMQAGVLPHNQRETKMQTGNFIGRTEEISLLEAYCSSNNSELVAVYGRRRVGKTFLIRHVFEGRFDFEYTAKYRSPAKVQIREFQRELNRLSGNSAGSAGDWFEAFQNLQDFLISLGKERVLVFIDELPWMDTAKSDFLAAFSSFWNCWRSSGTLLKVYVCGSATTWMVDKFIGDPGGLYGRISRSVYLSPFSLLETERYLNDIRGMHYSRKQVLDTYMIFGGVPYYLAMLDREKTLSRNVDALLFAENAPLRPEFDFIFRSLFKDSSNYRRVVETLAAKMTGLTREEISKGSRLSGGELTRILKNLISCDFIRSYTAPRKKERAKLYQLTDMFSLFYLRFIGNGDAGQDENFWTNLGKTGVKNSWAGYAFEQVCLHHIRQIKLKLGISGILSNVYAWSMKAYTDANGSHWDGGQIDLIIDRKDDVMNLCEMKYSSDSYEIDAGYESLIRKRIETFRHAEMTRKDLRCTFITLYGVRKNKHSGIVDSELVLDDLFA